MIRKKMMYKFFQVSVPNLCPIYYKLHDWIVKRDWSCRRSYLYHQKSFHFPYHQSKSAEAVLVQT